MNNNWTKYLFFQMGHNLINFFKEVIDFKDDYGFDISVDENGNGHISKDSMSISFIGVSNNEDICVYHDDEGMFCINTNSFYKTFVKLNGKTYFNESQFEKEPFDFVQRVNEKLNKLSQNEKKKVKEYHI